MVDLVWRGDKKFNRALSKLSGAMEVKVAASATRKGAAHLRKRIVARLPLGPGGPKKYDGQTFNQRHLKKSVSVVKIRGFEQSFLSGKFRRKKTTGYLVGYRGVARRYGHLLEFGTINQAPNRIWTETFEQEAQNILDIQAAELRVALGMAATMS